MPIFMGHLRGYLCGKGVGNNINRELKIDCMEKILYQNGNDRLFFY